MAATYQLSTCSFHTAPELSATSQRSIPTLLGKSNFNKWHSNMDPILLSDEQARALAYGTWSEPPSPRCPDSTPTTLPNIPSPVSPVTPASTETLSPPKVYTFLHTPSLSRAAFGSYDTSHRAYEMANLTVCRFIRGTLAMNVIPFVRQHTSAKALYEQIIFLYGEQAGIDMVGGPAVFGAIDLAFQGGKMTESKIGRIFEEHEKSPISLKEKAVGYDAPGLAGQARLNRLTTDSGLGYGINVATLSLPGSEQPQKYHYSEEKRKKRVAFRFFIKVPFRRSSTSSSSKTVISPIQRSALAP